MADLSIIENKKLRSLLEASGKFSALAPRQQKEHIDKMAHLSDEKQQRVCDFLTQENSKENQKPLTGEEKLEILNRLYDEVVDLERRFSKLLRKDTEIKQKQTEAKTMSGLLEQINDN